MSGQPPKYVETRDSQLLERARLNCQDAASGDVDAEYQRLKKEADTRPSSEAGKACR